MKRFAVLLFALALITGCADPNARPWFGKWNGEFTVDSLASASLGGPEFKVSQADLPRYSQKGFLQIYANGRKFMLMMQGEQQTFTATGTWSYSDRRITLQVQNLEIVDGGGEKLRDTTKVFLPSDAIRAAFGRTIVLDRDEDAKQLKGLTMQMGAVAGRFAFSRDSVR
jgi:hypothetical protein